MRQILTDQSPRATGRTSAAEPGDEVTLDEALPCAPAPRAAAKAIDLIELDNALKELAEADERSSIIVEMRFLAGMAVEEVAASLGISETTVKGRLARSSRLVAGALDGLNRS